jgi:hypothetical protein
MENSIFLIIIVILIVLSIWILTIKYFLNPLFLKPKLSLPEIIKFLNEKKCSFVEYKNLNKNEKQRNIFNHTKGFTIENVIYAKSEYKIIGFSESENIYKIFWLNLKSSLRLFGKRELNFIEEKDSELLIELQKEYYKEIIIVTDKCPACNNGILTNEIECKSCGLNLVA